MHSSKISHVDYLDWLRAFACLAVVILHSSDPLAFNFKADELYNHIGPIVLHKSFIWAVPIFFMITGALLIKPESKFNATYFITKRLQKVVVPFLCWSILYCLFKAIRQDDGFNWDMFVENVFAIPRKPQFGHLWFFYAYIPVLFFIPALQYLIRNTDNQILIFYFWVWFLLCVLYTLIIPTQGMLDARTLMYLGYALLGYLLFHGIGTSKLNPKHAFYIFITSLILNLLSVYIGVRLYGHPVRPKAGYFYFFVVLEAISIYWIFRTYFNVGNKLIKNLARSSLGIYLVHRMILALIQHKIIALTGKGLLSILIISSITFAASWFITNFLYRIRYTRFLVP